MQEIPIQGTSFLDEDAQSYPGQLCSSARQVESSFMKTSDLEKNQFSALQCWLECEPGYVAQRVPLITCVDGQYAKACHCFNFSRRGFSHFLASLFPNLGEFENFPISYNFNCTD